MKNCNFKGLKYYGLQQDKNGNIKLENYDDVMNARRARVDLLLYNTKQDDINLLKLNKALNEKLKDDKELSSEFNKEDQEIVNEKLKILYILDNLDNLTKIKSEDLLEISLLLSDLSFIEKEIVLNHNQNCNLIAFKNLFVETKTSGEKFSDEECKKFLDNINKINNNIKLELESRIEGLINSSYDKKNNHDDLQDEIAHAINITNKSKKK